VRNFSGSLDIQTGRGRVEAEVLDLRSQDEIHIRLEEGDIVLFLQPGVGAELEAEAPEGGISSEIELGQTLPAAKVSVQLGEGKTVIDLTALRGDIRIRKVEE
ncbi:MAG: hypothetical protein AB1715_08615, partial [Acidobacteriota bacterium]